MSAHTDQFPQKPQDEIPTELGGDPEGITPPVVSLSGVDLDGDIRFEDTSTQDALTQDALNEINNDSVEVLRSILDKAVARERISEEDLALLTKLYGLFGTKQMSRAEIADELGVHPDTVKARVMRIQGRLSRTKYGTSYPS